MVHTMCMVLSFTELQQNSITQYYCTEQSSKYTDLSIHHLRHDLEDYQAFKWNLLRDQLPENDAKGVHIGSQGCTLPSDTLRRQWRWSKATSRVHKPVLNPMVNKINTISLHDWTVSLVYMQGVLPTHLIPHPEVRGAANLNFPLQ